MFELRGLSAFGGVGPLRGRIGRILKIVQDLVVIVPHRGCRSSASRRMDSSYRRASSANHRRLLTHIRAVLVGAVGPSIL
eukprot:scaffold8174_cov151-Isochrysis_galbana.AAC.2